MSDPAIATADETREVQAEYFIDLEHAEGALGVIAEVCGKWGYDVFQITELRVTRGDDLWLSPVRGRDSLVVHFSSAPLPTAWCCRPPCLRTPCRQ